MNLKVKSKKVNDFTYELSISVPWEDIKEDFNSAKRKVSKEIKVSGFRKGKIPDNILMTQYLPNIEYAFVQDFCEKYYILSLQKEKLNPINQASLKDIDFSYENDLSFKSEFEIEPSLKLPKFKKNIGLSMILNEFCKIGSEVLVHTPDNKLRKGIVSSLPFSK